MKTEPPMVMVMVTIMMMMEMETVLVTMTMMAKKVFGMSPFRGPEAVTDDLNNKAKCHPRCDLATNARLNKHSE